MRQSVKYQINKGCTKMKTTFAVVIRRRECVQVSTFNPLLPNMLSSRLSKIFLYGKYFYYALSAQTCSSEYKSVHNSTSE